MVSSKIAHLGTQDWARWIFSGRKILRTNPVGDILSPEYEISGSLRNLKFKKKASEQNLIQYIHVQLIT